VPSDIRIGESGEIEVTEILESTSSTVKVRMKVLKCIPGEKTVAIRGIQSADNLLVFIKEIDDVPNTVVGEKRFGATRIVGTSLQLPLTLTSTGQYIFFKCPWYQQYNITPVQYNSGQEISFATWGDCMNAGTFVYEGTATPGTETIAAHIGRPEERNFKAGIPCTNNPTVSIKAENGISDPPAYIPVCYPITITGVVTPTVSGTYKWSKIDPDNKIEFPYQTQISGTITAPITQTAIALRGINPSTTITDTVGITFEFTPEEGEPISITHQTILIQVDLTFRNAERVSPQNKNDKHDPISNTYGTDLLGVLPRPITRTTDSALLVINGMEIIGRIINITPTRQSAWNFRRDIHSKAWQFTPDDANTPNKQPSVVFDKPFAGGPPAYNDDAGDTDEDLTPDTDNEIFVWDYPAIDLSATGPAPARIIFAHRFHAREWLELDGNRVSRVVEWISFITIRKEPDGTWKRVGQNVIRELRAGEVPSINFTREEAIAAQNE